LNTEQGRRPHGRRVADHGSDRWPLKLVLTVL
jgi:hypothetical protein